jgi:hypothetical protein
VVARPHPVGSPAGPVAVVQLVAAEAAAAEADRASRYTFGMPRCGSRAAFCARARGVTAALEVPLAAAALELLVLWGRQVPAALPATSISAVKAHSALGASRFKVWAHRAGPAAAAATEARVVLAPAGTLTQHFVVAPRCS